MPKRATKPKSDKGSRAARSGFQGGLVALLIMLINAFIDPDLTTEQVGVISVVALPVFSYLMNALEDASGVAVISKRPATDALTGEEPFDLTQRELVMLAGESARHENEIERLEAAICDVRADLRLAPHDAEPRIRTEQADAPPRVERFRG